MTEPAVRRLNWGCGAHGEPGWVNADLKDDPSIELTGDIRDGLPCEDGAFDYAVSVHALCMLGYPDLVPALQELRRVLRPGGVLRLCLPDLEKGVAAWQRGDAGHFFVPDDEVRHLSSKFIVHMLWYGWTVTLFTKEFVEELLEKAGFVQITHCGCGESPSGFAGITELDNRPDESLFVEATRP